MTVEELAEKIGPEVAKAFAPYIAQEMRRNGDLAGPEPRVTSDWDPRTCALFVEELGDTVLVRANDFFTALERDGEIDSLELTQLIKANKPRELSPRMTTPLKRRARSLGLERPWDQRTRTGRTVWVDRNDIARRMVEAIHAEHKKRGI